MVPVRACAAWLSRGAAVLCASATAVVLFAAAPMSRSIAAEPPAQALNGDRAKTRFVIMLEKSVDFHVSSLQSPNRVVVELPDVKMQLPAIGSDQPIGLVKSFRSGTASAGKIKLIIDVTEPVIVESSKLEPGKDGRSPRLVLDIVPVEAGKAQAKRSLASAAIANVGLGSVQPPLPRKAERPEVRDAKAFKPVIVLDPGHGGMDSGAVRHGAVEKEVVLQFALALRDKLNASGRYRVIMTRDSDKFVHLDERRAFSEGTAAAVDGKPPALFIAIHADYAGASARGATIYSLRDSVASDLKRSAKGEVAQNALPEKEFQARTAGDASDKSAVKGILSDLATREVEVTKARTSLFSRAVIEKMGAQTTMMSNPDRTAAFRVLKTAKAPAVLIELAYVSNKDDAAKLNSSEWRNKVSSSIMTAVDNYFANQIARFPM